MRTTLNLKDDLIEEAMRLTKIQEKTSLIHVALEELIAKHSRARLKALGGSDPRAKAPKRRGS